MIRVVRVFLCVEEKGAGVTSRIREWEEHVQKHISGNHR